jgi:ferredoxin
LEIPKIYVHPSTLAVPPALERQARRAVSGCPVLALRLARISAT